MNIMNKNLFQLKQCTVLNYWSSVEHYDTNHVDIAFILVTIYKVKDTNPLLKMMQILPLFGDDPCAIHCPVKN